MTTLTKGELRLVKLGESRDRVFTGCTSEGDDFGE